MPSAVQPCRVEFWGDEIDTVSSFDIDTQRRTEYIDGFVITPSSEIIFDSAEEVAEKIEKKANSLRGKAAALAKPILYKEADKLKNNGRIACADKFYSLIYEKPSNLFDYIAKDSFVFVSEQPKLKERMKAVIWQWGEDIKDYLTEGILCKGLDKFTDDLNDELKELSKRNTVFIDNYARGTCELPLKELVNFNIKQTSPWSGSLSVLCEDIDGMKPQGKKIVVLAGTEKFADGYSKPAERLPSLIYIPLFSIILSLSNKAAL